MVTHMDLKLQVPGGYKLDITFETPQDLIDYIALFKPQADKWNMDLNVKERSAPADNKKKIVVKG